MASVSSGVSTITASVRSPTLGPTRLEAASTASARGPTAAMSGPSRYRAAGSASSRLPAFHPMPVERRSNWSTSRRRRRASQYSRRASRLVACRSLRAAQRIRRVTRRILHSAARPTHDRNQPARSRASPRLRMRLASRTMWAATRPSLRTAENRAGRRRRRALSVCSSTPIPLRAARLRARVLTISAVSWLGSRMLARPDPPSSRRRRATAVDLTVAPAGTEMWKEAAGIAEGAAPAGPNRTRGSPPSRRRILSRPGSWRASGSSGSAIHTTRSWMPLASTCSAVPACSAGSPSWTVTTCWGTVKLRPGAVSRKLWCAMSCEIFACWSSRLTDSVSLGAAPAPWCQHIASRAGTRRPPIV